MRTKNGFSIRRKGIPAFLVALLSGWLNITTGYAQKMDFKNYSVNEGLPHAQIRAIHQTRDGHMWIGTAGSGLVKFDGTDFTAYTTEHGLPNNIVTAIFEDDDQNLWVGTSRGGVVTSQADSLVARFHSDSLKKYLISRIRQFQNGEIWIGTNDGGIFIYNGQELSQLTVEDGLIHNKVWDFLEDENGEIWIATQSGLSVFDGKEFRNYTQKDGLSGEKIFRIIKTDAGQKWIATDQGYTVWDKNGFKAVKQIDGKPLNYIFDLIQTDDGTIWIGTEYDGLYAFDGETYKHITRANGLSSNYIYTLFEDDNRYLWVGTNDRGLSVFRNKGFTFFDEGSGLPSNEILSIHQDREGMFWVGTDRGLSSFDGERFTHYDIPGWEKPEQVIWDITELKNGHILLVLNDNTILEFDGKIFSNYTDRHGLQRWHTYELFVDSGNTLWLGTDVGLIGFDGKSLQHYTNDDGLPGNVIYHIYEDPEQNLWIGTYHGVSKFDGESFQNLRLQDGLNNEQINFITRDSRGDFWFGTGGGISYYRPAGDEGGNAVIKNFDKNDGMVLVETLALWFDKDGQLWQLTNGGIHHLDVASYRETGRMKIVHYPLSSRGVGVEGMHKAVLTDPKGYGWFGTMEGLVQLGMDRTKWNDPAPVAVIKDVRLNIQRINWKDLADTLRYRYGSLMLPEVTFPYGKNVYTFSYAGLNFTNPQGVRYRFRLQGFEEEWMPETQSRSATYTNLDPGEYSFQVQARVGGGEWSEPAVYRFSVGVPFWQTYWFWGIIIIAFGSSIYGYVRHYLSTMEKRKLTALVEEQTKDLTNTLKEKEVLIQEIHHRVKNNLAVISGLLELQLEHVDNANARRILNESHLRIHSISMIHEKLYQNENLSRIDFKKYTEELVDAVIASIGDTQKNISVHLEVDDFMLSINQGIPCGLILNELVSNAYEHAFEGREEGAICVVLKKEGDTIRLRVEDNGVGLSGEFNIGQNNTLGLTLVRTLTKQLGGSLDIAAGDKPGSAFTIVFPYSA